MPEKALKYALFKNLILEYFPKIPSEMNSTHPFYPILIPNTSYVRMFIMFVGGPKTLKLFF